MVHALREAHRLLKADGILMDLRPTLQHRRVGLADRKSWQLVGVMREKFIDDRAANRAITKVMRAGLFRCEACIEFEFDRVMDTIEDFLPWLDEFVQRDKAPSHDWLVKRLEQGQHKASKKVKIEVHGPVMMRVMRKLSSK